MKNTGERFIPGEMGVNQLEHLNRYYFVVNQFDLKNKIVLDIASGEGYGSSLLAKFAKTVIGVDIDSETVEHAKNKYQRSNLNYILGNAIAIPLADKSVDLVVSFETIEHHDKHIEMILEIKRVLKADGILIISSPDKYYYSDIVNFKNEFHLKELYNNEFKELMCNNFAKTVFFSQKTFTGSIIVLDEESEFYKKPLVVDKAGDVSTFLPLYNIAICSENHNFTLNYQIVMYKESDNVLSSIDIDIAKQKIRLTKTYRIGNLILKPFKLLKQLCSVDK